MLAAILGGMFVVNLFLAVTFDEFMRVRAALDAEKEVGRSTMEASRAPPAAPTSQTRRR